MIVSLSNRAGLVTAALASNQLVGSTEPHRGCIGDGRLPLHVGYCMYNTVLAQELAMTGCIVHGAGNE